MVSRHAAIICGKNPLQEIGYSNSCSRVGGDCALSSSYVSTTQPTVLLTVGQLLVLIATDLIFIRVAPTPLGEQLVHMFVCSLEPQLAIHNAKSVSLLLRVRLVVRDGLLQWLALINYKFCPWSLWQLNF